jgi:acyl-CoA synthetase (AMP-forming)/AMP-acid ligase II
MSLNTVTNCTTWIEVLQTQAENCGGQTAFSFLGRSSDTVVTYSELERIARNLAYQLSQRIEPNKTVLLFQVSGLGFVSTMLACFYAGIIAVPAFPPRASRRSMDRLEAIAADANAEYALIDPETAHRIQPVLNKVDSFNRIQFITVDPFSAEETSTNWRPPRLSGDSVALIQYTSGSTAKPRGVILKHKSLLHNADMIGNAFEGTEKDTNVGWLPLYHDMGLIGNVMAPLYNRVHSILMRPEDVLMNPMRWLEAISQFEARTSGGPNFAYELCVDRISDDSKAKLNLSSWEVAFCGAEPIRANTLQRFYRAFAQCGFREETFYPCYGLAEATLLVTGGTVAAKPHEQMFSASALREHRVVSVTDKKDARSLVGCGSTWKDQEVMIMDPETNRVCRENRVGEIWIHGTSVASGYWNQPEDSKAIFQNAIHGFGQKNWLRTGDLGFWYQNQLFIAGRLKALIIVNGQNHFAEDIEMTVEQTNEAVCRQGVAAFGVEVKNAEQTVVVVEVDRHYLRRVEKENKDIQIVLEELNREIRVKVAENHNLTLETVHLVRQMSIPKTSSGKVRRAVTCSAFLEGTLLSLEKKDSK